MEQPSGSAVVRRCPERLSLEDVQELQERQRQKRQQEWDLFQQFRHDSHMQNAADDDLGGAQRSDDILDDEDSDEEVLSRVNRNLQREQEPFSDRTNLSRRTPSPNGSSEPCKISEWDGCTQDAIIKHLKAIDPDQLKDLGIREFFKSYLSWEKLTNDQKNKTVSYIRSLPEELQGLFFSLYSFFL
jgi:hypothetical protein